MKYLVKASLNLCCRWVRTRWCSCGVRRVLLALGMLGMVSATSLSAAELVSVNKDGTNSGSSSGYSYGPVISANGRFVAFTSFANDLVATDTNGRWDVFVRDLQSGTTTLVSVNKDGTDSGRGTSYDPMISAGGRFVVFSSGADDLVTKDTNAWGDVFVRDLQSGTTSLVSVNKDGTNSGHGSSYSPVISADGRFVVFSSHADDLVATDSNGKRDVFVRDLQSGTTTLVSVNKDGTDSGSGFGYSYGPVISADGRFVAFYSYAGDLADTDTNGDSDVFVRDLQSGTTILASVNKDGTDSGHGSSYNPVISADGRAVVFTSAADDLVATDSNGEVDVFVRDLQSGTTTLLSVNKDGIYSGTGYSGMPVMSADGRFVAFISRADDLVAIDTKGRSDVFVRDLQSGITTLVSVNKDGTAAGNGFSRSPVISADGRFVAFVSVAGDLVATDSHGLKNVFVRDLQSGTTTLASVNKDAADAGNAASDYPEISADGRVVVFTSAASDLVAMDTNGRKDVFAFEVFETPQGCNCADPNAIQGTAGPDFLYGTEQADIICGLGAQDFIAGMGGDDCIDGGDGNDWIYGGGGNDTIYGRAGEDVLYGSGGNDEISGDEDNDFLFGGVGDDRLDGGEGYDRLFCGSGTDEGIGESVRRCEN